ncbi:mycofactocin biosynthesis chaperone MftB [Parasphingorhabdus pacifica]
MSIDDRVSDEVDASSGARDGAFDPERRYRLSPNVSLRPESFGALAYHFGNRKLSFLKSPRLVAIVRSLEDHASARAAVESGDMAEGQRASYLRALASLARTDMIVSA